MLRLTRAVAIAGTILAVIVGEGLAQGPAPSGGVTLLDQNWSPEERLQYYYTSQGSAALHYDVFLALEQAGSQELFRSDTNMSRIGLVPAAVNARYNPDALPVGIAKATVADGRFRGDWAGLTCAACHNAQLQFKGAQIRIAGGTNHTLDMHAFVDGLDEALQATVKDPAKFDRMAARLNVQDTPGREALRKQVTEDAAAAHTYRLQTALTPFQVGPGRVDALALIHNQVLGSQLGFPENLRPVQAPVKYSFVWNIPQSAWAQWSGVLPDPVLRNGGEVVGVYAKTDLTSPSTAQGLFESSIDFRGLIKLENLLRKLAPPAWPEAVLGPIDRTKAAAGKQLFAENCGACHSSWPHRWTEPRLGNKRFIENAIVRDNIIGTDPTQFGNPQFGDSPSFRPGRLGQFLPPAPSGPVLSPAPDLFSVIRNVFFVRELDKLGLSPEERLDAHNYKPFFPDPQDPPPAVPAYKANPIEGMWSSPPFLHNGSVPNLYELLLPAAQRSRQFFVGRDFDPVRVGVDTSGQTGRFLMDTTKIGNSNAGHSFQSGSGPGVIGRLLTDDERWALVEYVKSAPESPAQVTPLGGPANPVRAWLDPTFYHVRNPGTYNGAPQLMPVAALGQETVPPGEQAFIDFILKATLDRLKQQFPPGVRPVLRDAHPKTHGLVTAEFIVLDGLPDALRHGVFRKAGRFDAIMRFSAGGVEVQPDTEAQAAGLGIKLLGVEGEKLLPAERNATTQDFVMINFPTFFVRSLEDYEALHVALATPEGQAAFFRTHPAEAAAAAGMRNQGLYNPVAGTYFSQTPYRLGPNAIKFSVRPISGVDNTPPSGRGPNFMRDALARQVGAGDVYLEFAVQLQTDPQSMPIEDSLQRWDESRSPYQRVALIRIPRQTADTEARRTLAENMAFTPWHSLPEHRPLGSINRSRLSIYETISEFRRTSNGTIMPEPVRLPD